jgi:Tol biopolymer transport system component
VRALAVALLTTLILAVDGASAAPPGGRIVFVRMVVDQFELFKVRPDGSGLVRLTRNRSQDSEPAWAPDGRRFVAAAGAGLVLRSPDGRLIRRLPAPGAFAPTWSPDGRLLAYLVARCWDPSGKLGPACADLWVIRPDGTGRRRLVASDVDQTIVSRPYAWAPDGRRLVYTSLGRQSLVIVTVRDGRKGLLPGSRASADPSWSPDGRWITFGQQRGLYAVAPDGTRRHRLARGYVSLGIWSPDGRHIAYLRSLPQLEGGDERWAVVAAEPDGGRPRRLAVAGDPEVLLWSPDSTHVLWRGYAFRLTIARADGRGRPALVTTGEAPTWG